MRRMVFNTMGTVVSIVFRTSHRAETLGAPSSSEIPSHLRSRIISLWEDYDARFSLYRADSELSRVNSGQLTLAQSSPQLRHTYALAHEWRMLTNGSFTPERPDRTLDLNGVVKALAMHDTGNLLSTTQYHSWLLTAGGDVLSSPETTEDSWDVGIIDPFDREALLSHVYIGQAGRAIATSGSAERGDHIWKVGGHSRVVQASVIADSIVTADVLATAIVSAGIEYATVASERWGVEVLAIDSDDRMVASPRFRAHA